MNAVTGQSERKAMTPYVAVTAPSTRVRRGLQRVLFAAECELDALRGKANYTTSGMTRREYENFKLAVEWVRGLIL